MLRGLARSLSTSSMRSEPILFERIASKTHPYASFGHIKLNRPAARNALSNALVTELQSVIESIRRDDRIRAVILDSSTDGMFCAGADLAERRTMSASQVSAFLTLMRQTFTALEDLSIPTLSLISGHALGGGLELALCTDFRILTPTAKVGLPETKLGIIPGAGGTQRLTRLIGATRTKELVFTARIVSQEEAVVLGIGMRGSFTDALALCESFVTQSPGAVGLAKQAVRYATEGHTLESGLDFERARYDEAVVAPDRDEGLLAFKEKRAPIYGIPKNTKSKL